MSHITQELYVSNLVKYIDKQSAEIERLRAALVWCSASEDFQEGGQAREGWLKLCKPLIDARRALEPKP